MTIQGLTQKKWMEVFSTCNSSGGREYYDVQNFSAEILTKNGIPIKVYSDNEINHLSTGVYIFTITFPEYQDEILLQMTWQLNGLSDGKRLILNSLEIEPCFFVENRNDFPECYKMYEYHPDGQWPGFPDFNHQCERCEDMPFIPNFPPIGYFLIKQSINCSTNPVYPASTIGDCYKVSGAGKIGGSSGLIVSVGDILVCNNTTAGGLQSAAASDFSRIPTCNQ